MPAAAALLLLAPALFGAEPSPQSRRPRIGLVLSGGSARGLSHIGVIQWLQERRIPIDMVAGTSMGGLVGGLYATGHDTEELKQFARSVDWATVISTVPPFHELAFRRKEDRREFPNKLEFGLRHGLTLPSGLSAGQEVGLVLSRFAAPYSTLRSFDDLPTPFRCVAVDLITGKQVVFERGDLGVALRSTMSLPAVFSPLSHEEMVLADGGMLNNLPVDVMKKMGAEVIIAVTLIDPDVKPENVASLLGVANRSLGVMIDANARRSMAMADILVSPELDGLKSADFAKYEEFEKRGYAAAEKKKRFLEVLSVPEAEWAAYLEQRRSRRKTAGGPPLPQFVRVRGAVGDDTRELEREMEKRFAGKPPDRDALEEALTQITGTGMYQSASWSWAEKDGRPGLEFTVHPKRHGPPFLNTGVTIDGSETSNVRFGFGARLTALNKGLHYSDWRTDVTIGLTNLISTEYYVRLRGGRVFVAPRAFALDRQEDLYLDKTRFQELRVRNLGFGGDIGFAASRFAEGRFGYEFKRVTASVGTGIPFPGFEEFAPRYHTARLRWVLDTQDSPVVPRRGVYSLTELRWNKLSNTSNPDHGTIEQLLLAPKAFGTQYVALTALRGGTTLGPRSLLPAYSLGGPGAMGAFGRGQLRGETYYYGSLTGLRAFSADRSNSLNRTFLAIGYEIGDAWTPASRGSTANHDGFFGVISETFFGPVFIGGALGTDGNRKFFFRVGRLF